MNEKKSQVASSEAKPHQLRFSSKMPQKKKDKGKGKERNVTKSERKEAKRK